MVHTVRLCSKSLARRFSLVGYVTNGTVGCGQKNEEVVIKVVKVFLAPQVLY